MAKKSTSSISAKQRDDIAKALEILFTTEYISRKKLYIENFIRGLVFGAGSLLGATIVIGLLVWVLSLFDGIPLIGPIINDTRETIEQGSKTR